MRIVFISNVLPTPDNYRAASALSYHLLRFRPEQVEVVCYTFNANHVPQNLREQVERDLNMKINLVNESRFIKILFKLHLIFLKNFLPYPFGYYNQLDNSTVKAIKALKPDGIWVNGDCLSVAMKQFEGYPRVMTMPDCVPLYYHRLMGDKFLFCNWIRMMGNCDQYYKNIKMEREYPVGDRVTYHLVGEKDRQFFQLINPSAKAVFIHHPHYNYLPGKKIKFSSGKIKILVAGQYNLYMKTAFDELLPKLCADKELAESFSITFLGKGWDFAVRRLQDAGYQSCRLCYVDVYLEEIVKYDIQLTPISVGTGTKGKVLDALANGLLVIGTPYALENIAVKDGESCIMYRHPDDVVKVLHDIKKNPERYEFIAEAGRRAVLTEHNRSKVSEKFFELFQ